MAKILPYYFLYTQHFFKDMCVRKEGGVHKSFQREFSITFYSCISKNNHGLQFMQGLALSGLVLTDAIANRRTIAKDCEKRA